MLPDIYKVSRGFSAATRLIAVDTATDGWIGMTYPTLTYPTTGGMISWLWSGECFVFHGLVMPLILIKTG